MHSFSTEDASSNETKWLSQLRVSWLWPAP